jgi:hypothetical protein
LPAGEELLEGTLRLAEAFARHPADLDGDGALTLFDFLRFQSLWDASDPRADLDGDGAFTLFDFLEYQVLFDR